MYVDRLYVLQNVVIIINKKYYNYQTTGKPLKVIVLAFFFNPKWIIVFRNISITFHRMSLNENVEATSKGCIVICLP